MARRLLCPVPPILALAILVAPPGSGASAAEEPLSDDERLETLLVRLGRLSQLFEEGALTFACEETITWKEPGYGSDRHRFSYVFERNDLGEIEDYRTWAGGGRGHGIPREVVPEEFHVPTYLRSAYLWSFAFKPSRQDRHEYSIVGDSTVLGRAAVGVRFVPVPPFLEKVNDWAGVAWVDRETSQLLKVEAWGIEDYRRMQTLKAHVDGELPRLGLEPYMEANTNYTIERIVTEFSVEKNGMRFPGKVVIERDRHRVREKAGMFSRKTTRLLRVQQVYKNYEFFNVRTASETLDLIVGD